MSVSLGLFRRLGPANLFGPLFTYELIRLARRGRTTLLRCLYALLLLGALGNAYYVRFGNRLPTIKEFSPRTRVTINEMADFSRLFILGVLVVQGSMVLIVTPVYLAGAVTEEKERKTLSLLFASHLGDREIILGKLLSRLTLLGSLVLTGLPVLVLTSLMAHGTDRIVLLTTFAVTLMTLVSVGSLSILCSVLCKNSLTSLLCSYGLLLLFNLPGIVPCALPYTSPLGFLYALDTRFGELSVQSVAKSGIPVTMLRNADTLREALPMTTLYVILHGLFAAFCTKVAIDSLRTTESDEIFHTPPASKRLVPVSSAFDLAEIQRAIPERPDHRASLLPPMKRDPLLWKEMVHDPPARLLPYQTLLAWIGSAVVIGCALYWVPILFEPHADPEPITKALNYVLRVPAIVLACLYGMGLTLRTASSVSRERDRHTLEMLLTVPDNRPAILRAKWLGGMLRLRFLGLLLLGVLLLGLGIGVFHPLGLLLFVAHCAAVLLFLASVSVWISLMARNTMWAQLSAVLLLLLLFAVPMLRLLNQAYPGELSSDPEDRPTHLWQIGLNPVVAWWLTACSWKEWRDSLATQKELFKAEVGAIVYGFSMLYALAALFWAGARRRLDREPVN